MRVRCLNDAGRDLYHEWLEHRKAGELPPRELLDGSDYTLLMDLKIDIDPNVIFASRFEFGKYMANLLGEADIKTLLSVKNDGMWDWLTVAYFSQFGRKASKYWHYTVTRRGHAGSLAYRHLARTAFEMYWRHGEASLLLLHVDMSTGGEMAEALTSRQDVAYHRGYIQTAYSLYWDATKLKMRRGAAGRVKPLKRRKVGDTSGRGGAGRLALAVRRLCRTHDTHLLDTDRMIEVLPKEFKNFIAKSGPVVK